MEKELVPYEQALALKELGFDEPCFGEYYYGKLKYDEVSNGQTAHNDLALAPTFSQAFRWFREKHNLHSTIIITSMQNYGYLIEEPQVPYHIDQLISYKTYEEAELECLKKLIEIIQSQKTSDESPHTRTFRTPSSDYNSRGQYRK